MSLRRPLPDTPASRRRPARPRHLCEVRVSAGSATLEANFGIPADAQGVVLFAHGSGSGRHSPRNHYVAETLCEAGQATLLIDLLTPEEEEVDMRTRHLRFDIRLLADRLAGATDWLAQNPDTRDPSVGYFGASTGAGAALVAAAERPEEVGAIVSRGGRPDLAEMFSPMCNDYRYRGLESRPDRLITPLVLYIVFVVPGYRGRG